MVNNKRGVSPEYSKIAELEDNLIRLEERFIIKKPSHFSHKDFARAFLGSIIFGFTFALKPMLIELSQNLTQFHVYAIIISTLTIATIEIFYIGYRRLTIKERRERKFGQFWFKRITTYYFTSLLVSLFLIYVYNINSLHGINGWYDIMRVVICLALPCTIGASASDLLKQY